MASSDRLLELLVQWEEERRQGRAPAAEELCPDDPALQATLRERIRQRECYGKLWTSLGWSERTEAGPGSPAHAGKSHGPATGELPERPRLADHGPCGPELGPVEKLPERLAAEQHDTLRGWGRGEDGSGERAVGSICRPEEFRGTPRFAVERRIGAGGMGVVYRAYDRERDQVVAIKTLRFVDAAAIYRLKREFRALADIVHPNLVSLYELFFEEGQWFFTMEFVEGIDFLRYVRSGNVTEAQASCPAPSAEPCEFPRPDAAPTPSRPQLGRLRAGLGQLAEGVLAIHQAGKLHRDIKPSNVLVPEDGRVVLLDFGLATELTQPEGEETTAYNLVGTAAYMSPEQAVGARLSPASDWYSVGVMLYEALTGRRPFVEQGWEVLQKKQEADPPAPSQLVAGIPEDLNTLCMALLDRDPERRPCGAEVHSRVRIGAIGPVAIPTPSAPSKAQSVFVGRQEQLRALADAFRATARGRSVVVYVQGASGVGKTALVQRFLQQIRGAGQTVVLAGRCYECESVPYKALDSVVDALTRYLAHLPRHEADALMPRDIADLLQLFPVLGQVTAAAEAPRRGLTSPDMQELRQRASDALRELLTRLGDRQRVVLHIDDMQWADLDSVALLDDLLGAPRPPVLLLIVSYRNEDAGTSPVLRALFESRLSTGQHVDILRLGVEPLGSAETEQLARALIPQDAATIEGFAANVARESHGNPYFLTVLAREQGILGGPRCRPLRPDVVGLDDVLWAHAKALPDVAYRLLQVVAVAGHPLRQVDACAAAQLGTESREALKALRTAHMIRSSGGGLEEEIETYHDRIRETVVARLAPDKVADCHRRLATTLEKSGGADAAILAGHFASGQESEKAGTYYALAAAAAAKSLAFDRAADLYRSALELLPAGGDNERDLRIKLADSLANAGRNTEAAKEYLAAIIGATRTETVELKRRAALQLLINGQIEEGITILREVLASAGMRFPKSHLGAMLVVAVRRTMLWLRGLHFSARPVEEIPADVRARIDACVAVSAGLSRFDPLLASGTVTHGLLLSLRWGDPYWSSWFLAAEAAHRAIAGGPARVCVDRLMRIADSLAIQSGTSYAVAAVQVLKGMAAFLQGRWKEACEILDRSDAVVQEQVFDSRTGVGLSGLLDLARNYSLWSAYYAGEVAEIARRLPGLIAMARRRNNYYALANFATISLPALAADDPGRAEEEMREAMSHWSRHGFHIQHLYALYSQLQCHLYRGDALAAQESIRQQWPVIARSFLFRVQLIRGLWWHTRARSALAAATAVADGERLVRLAERDARRLEKENMAWIEPLARIVRAAIAVRRGDASTAIQLLEDTVKRFDQVDMPLYAAVARRRLGELLGGDRGRDLVAQADAWMASQGVVDASRMTALFAPGFPSR